MGALDRIPLARPAIGNAELAAAERALRSGRLVLGPENRRLEAMLAARTGRAHAVCVSSGTVALELALWALPLARGAEVLIPSFGFAAAANAVVRCGGVPVPVDVDPATWNVDLESVRRNLCAASAALVSIDQLGLVNEAAPLQALAREHQLALIDDAACALGGTDSRGTPGGGYGSLATLSFHPRKAITTGEGGALLTDDAELAGRLRELRNQGQRDRGRFVRHGTNARMSEVAAAIGTAQLECLDAMLAERRLLADGYRRRLAPLHADGRVSWQEPPEGAMHAYQTFAMKLHPRYDRQRVIAALDGAGIEAAPATYALHRLEAFASAARHPLPVSDGLHDLGLALPLYIGMRSLELDRVADALKEALG